MLLTREHQLDQLIGFYVSPSVAKLFPSKQETAGANTTPIVPISVMATLILDVVSEVTS